MALELAGVSLELAAALGLALELAGVFELELGRAMVLGME